MLKKFKNKINKIINLSATSFLLSGTLIVGCISNSFAPQEVYANDISFNISSWAIETLNEAEKYDIFPQSWYFDDITLPISEDKLDYLLDGVNNKLISLNLPKKDNFISHALDLSTSNLTRGNIATELFNILDQYNFGQSFETPIDYFIQKSIILGDGLNLNLDQICTTEQAIVISTKFIEAVFNDLDAGSKGFVWQVQNKDNLVYLLGSIHLGTTDIYPLNQKLKDAFDSSDNLHVEVNIFGEEDSMYDFIQIATYQDGTTIRDYISDELYQKLVIVCDLLGISIDYLSNFKPWSVANDLNNFITTESQSQEEVQIATEHGIDMYFLTRSLVSNKEISELESYEFQAMIFDSMSEELQLANLEYAVDQLLLYSLLNGSLASENSEQIIQSLFTEEIAFENIALLDNFDYVDDTPTTIKDTLIIIEDASILAEEDIIINQDLDNQNQTQNQTIENWLNYFKLGDVQSITNEFYELLYLNNDTSDEINTNEYVDSMLDNTRDNLMANKIIELLEAEGESTHFVVVGAAHFLLEGSILDILEQEGYTIEDFYKN